MKTQTRIAFQMPDVSDGREYEDALVFNSPALGQVKVQPVKDGVYGHWYIPKCETRDITVLYLHGGGYAFYSKAHQNLIALIALAAKSQTFALDYRLIPEHPFPAQLEDAVAAYQWLLKNGVQAQEIVIAGDSAGGNLALSLLISLRDTRIPLPGLVICISPWTDLGNSGASMIENELYDWVKKQMAEKWAQWFCKNANPRDPLVSPVHADLGGLPPIYIQAGSAEILHDMILAFADHGRKQGANIILDVWKNMNHDFQAFGDRTPESKEALERIDQVIRQHMHSHPHEQ
ncbi:MAG: alpha/beta hydrolase, partial [Candidatus Kryptoniota bacterium]